MLYLLHIFLIAGLSLRYVDASCNVCGDLSGVACTDEKGFKICINGVPQDGPGSEGQCAANEKCVNEPDPCSPLPSAEPFCVPTCGRCSDDLRFACVGQGKFAFCRNTTTPMGKTYECPSGYVCVRETTSPGFCEEAGEGIEASCKVDQEIPVSFRSVRLNPTNQCQVLKTPGRHIVADDCKKYLFCFLYRQNWRGEVYTCPNGMFFENSTKTCKELSECPN